LLRWATVWPHRHGPKSGGCCAQFRGGSWVPIYHNVVWAEAYLRTKWNLDPSSRLVTIDMSQKVVGLLCHFFGGGRTGSPSNTMRPGSRPTSVPSGILVHRGVWPQQTWAENWGCAPSGGRWVSMVWAEAYRHAKFHLDPSNHLGRMHQRQI